MGYKSTMLFGFADKLTDEQKQYVDSIFSNQLTICNAKAGTGKTQLAIACSRVMGKHTYYIFSPVQEKVSGYRPGTQEEKEKAYLAPLYSALIGIGEQPDRSIVNYSNLDKKGNAWITPVSHTFLRGVNITNSCIIIDEAQNMTIDELRKILTRIHDDCKVILIGHTGQIDLDNKESSGFKRYIDHLGWRDYAKVIHLTYNFRGKLANDADEIS